MRNPATQYATIQEASKATGIKERTLRMKAPQIRGAMKVGLQWLIPRKAIPKLSVRQYVRRQGTTSEGERDE